MRQILRGEKALDTGEVLLQICRKLIDDRFAPPFYSLSEPDSRRPSLQKCALSSIDSASRSPL
jgi:hypothetical protein